MNFCEDLFRSVEWCCVCLIDGVFVLHMRRLRMFYPLEPNGAILTPIYTSNSGASTRTRVARPDICHDGRHMMAGYRLGSCCVSLRCSACLPVIMLRVLVLHDAAQLLLLLPLLLLSYPHL